MTDAAFDFRSLPRGTVLELSDRWGTAEARYENSGLRLVNTDNVTNTQLPSRFVVVLGLLEGAEDFDGIIVTCRSRVNGLYTYSEPLAITMAAGCELSRAMVSGIDNTFTTGLELFAAHG